MAAASVIADFELPPALEAGKPPEARGLARDDIRLLVSNVERDSIEHAHFRDLARFLSPGDVLVVNTSGTLKAAVPATSAGGHSFELHLSTELPGKLWTVEVRTLGPTASLQYLGARVGQVFALPGGGTATLLAPYPFRGAMNAASRLWAAALELPLPVLPYLDRYGAPIRYSYVKQAWPISMYQTIFATEPGSAEMPSAGRPFTTDLVTELVSKGVEVAPLLLHTGVASLENHEPPYEEFYRVPATTAARVNAARRSGHRIVAVGTTVVRALETVTDRSGTHPGEGWTSLIITPDRVLRAVDSIVTGLHEPRATHLAMLERFSGARHRERAYAEATRAGYLWHEFGDAHLILGRYNRPS